MTESYTEKDIKSLDWREHIRLRPGMYIGKLGDGSAADDGIYVLLKEVIDNSIDEYVMGQGKSVDITLKDNTLTVRDYGRGIPLAKVYECAAGIFTGAKFDSEAFKKSVGLNGVGLKAVNALSSQFQIEAFRDQQTRACEFSQGKVRRQHKKNRPSKEGNGTRVCFYPDEEIFGSFKFRREYIENMVWNYAYLNAGLTLKINGKRYKSKNGLFDLLTENLNTEPLYPIIHLKDRDIEVAFTHGNQYGEEYYSFVNGQHTTQGGTHQGAFREAIVKTIREFYKKSLEAIDVRASIIAAISIKIEEPIFESQTKTKLGSQNMAPEGQSIRAFLSAFIQEHLDNFLHRNPETSKALLQKIQQSERDRKELKGIQKIARERAKKANLHNKKLRDCRIHFNKTDKRKLQSTLFITEGNSASGSITKSRDVNTQAVFSLRGKPLNCFGLSKKVVYENEEFNLLQNALNIEDGLDNLRYNRIVLATDADVDGMHIRLLLITFFLQFFPDLVKQGHLYILQTPLFRVRNKKQTLYCYTNLEKNAALKKLSGRPEITRFKGLGEISSDEFKHFIDENMRLDPVVIRKHASLDKTLSFYMGKNSPERQKFIIKNLRIDQDLAEVT